MSRTRKGQKGPGYEFWSNRPGNKGGGLLGRWAKRRTHKAERRLAAKDVRDRCKEDHLSVSDVTP